MPTRGLQPRLCNLMHSVKQEDTSGKWNQSGLPFPHFAHPLRSFEFGSPLRRGPKRTNPQRPMTAEQAERCKRQQLKQLVYAERLNRGLPLEQGEHTVGEVAHLQGVWELGNVDGERTHHVQ